MTVLAGRGVRVAAGEEGGPAGGAGRLGVVAVQQETPARQSCQGGSHLIVYRPPTTATSSGSGGGVVLLDLMSLCPMLSAVTMTMLGGAGRARGSSTAASAHHTNISTTLHAIGPPATKINIQHLPFQYRNSVTMSPQYNADYITASTVSITKSYNYFRELRLVSLLMLGPCW